MKYNLDGLRAAQLELILAHNNLFGKKKCENCEEEMENPLRYECESCFGKS